jgi:hypothetical protein
MGGMVATLTAAVDERVSGVVSVAGFTPFRTDTDAAGTGTLFEEGMQLSAACRKELEEAEGKVEILLKQNGKLQAETFEPSLHKP